MNTSDRKALINILVALAVIEGFTLARVLVLCRYKQLKIEILQDVARYYADMLEKNEVALTDYDLIALNSILERNPSIKAGKDN
ncbi:membrane protein [Gordonia phage Schwartz33]|nr:membrane protein [Gordonia phage Schwartz33]